MNRQPVCVVIPVGPHPHHIKWMRETLESVRAQTESPRELFIVDDMAGNPMRSLVDSWEAATRPKFPVTVWRAPWRLGTACAVNCGVMEAPSECSITLGSDDLLHPDTIACSADTVEKYGSTLAYFWYDVAYVDDARERQSLPSGCAMFTKSMMKATGGLPLEGVVGHSDTMLCSILLQHKTVPFVRVAHPDGHALNLTRVHAEADHTTRSDEGWGAIIDQTRRLVTSNWKQPQWGRTR